MHSSIENVIKAYSAKKDINEQNSYYPNNSIVKEISVRQESGEIVLNLKYKSEMPIKQPSFGFVFYDIYENPLFGSNPIKNGILDFGTPKKEGEIEVVVTSPILADGAYPISIWFNDGIAYEEHIFSKEHCLLLHISDMNNSILEKNPKLLGYVLPICNWRFN